MPSSSSLLVRASLVVPLLSACKPAPSEPPELDESMPADEGAADPAALRVSEPDSPPPVAIYGTVRIPSLSRMLPLVAEQLVPPEQSAGTNEMMLRMGLQMMLGPRSELAEHVALDRPMGCVVASPLRYDVPLACTVGYQGGLSQLVEDLGPIGFVSGDDEHAAYRFEEQPLFLTAMGEHVAFASAPDLVAATRDRLQREVIDAPIGAEDVVITAQPSVIFEDAESKIMPFLDELLRTSAKGPMQQQNTEAQRKQWLSYAELERAELWLDLDGDQGRVRLGYRGTALPGTPTEEAYARQRQGSLEPELVERLPAGSPLIGLMRFDVESLMTDPMMGAYAQMWSRSDDPSMSAMGEVNRKSMALWSEVSTGHAAMALVHVPGTKGGVVVTQRLVSDADVLERVRGTFEGMSPAMSDAGMQFRAELSEGAVRVGKVRGDRVRLEPTTDALRQALQQAWGSPRLELAFVQQGDVMVMAIAPAKVERYVERGLATRRRGAKTLGHDASSRRLLAAHSEDTMVFAASMARILGWMQTLDLIDSIPPGVPVRPDDLVISMRPGAERQREVLIDLSADVIQLLYRLRGSPA